MVHAPVIALALEPITTVGVQAMMQAMLDRKMEETRELVCKNKEEPSTLAK